MLKFVDQLAIHRQHRITGLDPSRVFLRGQHSLIARDLCERSLRSIFRRDGPILGSSSEAPCIVTANGIHGVFECFGGSVGDVSNTPLPKRITGFQGVEASFSRCAEGSLLRENEVEHTITSLFDVVKSPLPLEPGGFWGGEQAGADRGEGF